MKKNAIYLLFCGALIILFSIGCTTENKTMEMESVIRYLQARNFVDLTHAFSPSIPIPDGFPKPQRESLFGGGVQVFTHVGQYGTHLDAPGHFHKGMRLVESIPVNEFILEGCVIDISEQSRENHDYQLTLDDVKNWERENGAIPDASMAILRTDWSKRWNDHDAFFSIDEAGQKHYPGWGKQALEYLIEERKVRAIGHETPDTDSGITCGGEMGWPLESYVLERNLWQVENLNNVDKLPAKDFLIIVGVPKADKATGFPVRVFAVLP